MTKAELTAENKLLRAAIRALAVELIDNTDECPGEFHLCRGDHACDAIPDDGEHEDELSDQAVKCWCKWAIAEADTRENAEVVPQ